MALAFVNQILTQNLTCELDKMHGTSVNGSMLCSENYRDKTFEMKSFISSQSF